MSTINDWSKCWPTEKDLNEALAGSSIRQLAAEHNVDRTTISNHVKGRKRQTAGKPIGQSPKKKQEATPKTSIEVNKDTAEAEFTEATITPDKVPTDKTLLKRANLDPEVWEVSTRRTSVWEAQAEFGEVKTMRSLRVGFSKRKDSPENMILPAFGGRPVSVKPPTRRKATQRDTELVVVMSDFHAPYHDQALLDSACQMLLEVQPDRLIINGDLVDFPTTGRHRKTTNNCQASANECIQVGGEILGQLRASLPGDCRVDFVPGNHDGWLSNFLLDRAGPAYDLCAAGSDVPVWSLRNLLRFDELGIQMAGTEDQWQHAAIQLTPLLVVRHGHSVRAGSAASVLANNKNRSHATISGHTHRMGIAAATIWAADGSHKVVQGAEIGGMYQLPQSPTDWPTYSPHNMDWQPGFATVEIEKDGHFSVDLASWQNGVLMWRGQRY